jgi:ABC-type nitrate/sulfonate/bicarbonate transport system permease component
MNSDQTIAHPAPAAAPTTGGGWLSGLAPRQWKAGSQAANRVTVVVFLLLALAGWQIASMFLPPISAPSPARVAWRFEQLWVDAGFISYALATVYHVIASVLIAFLGGVGIALLAYFVPSLQRAVYGRLAPFLNAFSGLGWAFLAVVWFGVTHNAVIFAASVALLPIAIINAGTGLRELDRDIVEMAVSFSRESRRRTWLVILPMLVPYLFATFRLCWVIGWHLIPTTELLTGSGGIGSLISIARQRFSTDMLLSIAFLNILIIYISDRLILAQIQKRMKRHYGL